MKELKEFTVERLEQVEKTPEKYDHRYLDNQLTASEARSLAKIALAAKQANPVGYLFVSPDGGIAYSISNVEFDGVKLVGPVFATPPLNHTEQDGWVKCSERIPDHKVEVIVITSSGESWIAHRNEISGCWDDGDFYDDIPNVTHWMPLSAAPKPEM